MAYNVHSFPDTRTALTPAGSLESAVITVYVRVQEKNRRLLRFAEEQMRPFFRENGTGSVRFRDHEYVQQRRR